MEEIKNESVQDEIVAQDEVLEETTQEDCMTENIESVETTAETVEEATVAPTKKKIKLPAGLQKIVDKINSNEDVRQMVVFTLFSFICGGSQMIITLVLPLLLKLGGGVLTEPFQGFDLGALKNVFGYNTTSDFIGFLIGSIVGQVLTFVLNRKKTFNCTNNVVISGIMYVILAVFIIFMQTLLGGAIMVACQNAKAVDEGSFLYQVYNLTGQAVGGISALIISFIGNKFLVMRNWGEGKKKKAEATCDCEECACEECVCSENTECDCNAQECACDNNDATDAE